MRAPTGRMASVTSTDATTFALLTWKSAASLSNRNTTTKKSKASSVQPRNDAVTAWIWPELERPATPLSRSLLNNSASHWFGSYWFGRHAQRNIAIEQSGAGGGHGQQRNSHSRFAKTNFADAK